MGWWKNHVEYEIQDKYFFWLGNLEEEEEILYSHTSTLEGLFLHTVKGQKSPDVKSHVKKNALFAEGIELENVAIAFLRVMKKQSYWSC